MLEAIIWWTHTNHERPPADKTWKTEFKNALRKAKNVVNVLMLVPLQVREVRKIFQKDWNFYKKY